MKIYQAITLIISAGALFLGCTKSDPTVGFSTDQNSLKIGADGGTKTVKVSSPDQWIATANRPWITVSPANGKGSTECSILIDSTLIGSERTGSVRIQNQTTWENQDINITQEGYGYSISVSNQAVEVANYADYGKRGFDVSVMSNVDFDVKVPDDAGWLTYTKPDLTLNRGMRPRECVVHFEWRINSQPNPRLADITFEPKSEVTLVKQDKLNVKQEAAEAIEIGRAGDSLALLAIQRSLNCWYELTDGSDALENWEGVEVWTKKDAGYTPEKEGRVRSASFTLFGTKEGLPYEVQYLTEVEELTFYGNTNTFLLNLTPGDYITKLTQLRRLKIGAYGLVSLGDNFTNLKNLESLDLGGNNFQTIPEEINPENFPKLHRLLLASNQRHAIYDLSNTVRTKYGGFADEKGFPRRLLEWEKLDTLVLSVNYLQGELPSMDDYQKYTEADIIAADTLPRELIGTPKVLPNMRNFTINLNRLYGNIPDWLLYHPALNRMFPFDLIFNQEGKTTDGRGAIFDNEPISLDYYYKFYEGYKTPPTQID